MLEIIKSLIYPSPVMIVGFIVLIAIDLITGIRKASKKGEATTSKGLRQTGDKALTYISLIVGCLVIFNIAAIQNNNFAGVFDFSINTLVGYCIYVELKSILENLIEINKDSTGLQNFLCEKVLVPLHNLIILKFK